MNDNGYSPKILIVDDQSANLDVLIKALQPEGYDILLARDGEAALNIASRASPDLILLDVIMPGIDGFEVCRRLKEGDLTQEIPVVFLTAKSESEDVVNGFQIGGVDYITKPFQMEEVVVRVRTHLQNALLTRALQKKTEQLQQEITERERAESAREISEQERQHAVNAKQKADEQLQFLSQQEAARWGIEGFIGQSTTIGEILSEIRQLQHANSTSVLITGESGTGKELIARAIHFGSARANAPFIPVNCSAIPSELAESTFFGHVRGAFTGATTSHKGYFELADGGTLFLDEIGDMPPQLQAKLLRVLEDSHITPVGGTREREIDVRILAATNADLQTQITDGSFREDLYYRLARFPVAVPPLRERPGDIPLLANHFLSLFAAEMRLATAPSFSKEALEAMQNYPFPGNVRELKNVIEHALIRSDGVLITTEHLSLHRDANSRQTPPIEALIRQVAESIQSEPLRYRQKVDLFEQKLIERALIASDGNRTQAARMLGIDRKGLYDKIQRLEIDVSP